MHPHRICRACTLYVSLDHILRMGGGDLQGYPLIPVMEGGDHPCGNELEDNGVAGILPSEYGAVKTVHDALPKNHIAPE